MNNTETKYLVEWAIDIWTDSPEAAANEAWKHQLDPNTTVMAFTVTEKGIRPTVINARRPHD